LNSKGRRIRCLPKTDKSERGWEMPGVALGSRTGFPSSRRVWEETAKGGAVISDVLNEQK